MNRAFPVQRAGTVLFMVLALALVSSFSVVAFAGAPHPDAPAEPTEAKAKEAEEEGPGAINWIDFSNKEQPPYAAVFLNFGLLAFLYYALGKKPVAEALAKHRSTVSKDIEEAQRMKHEAEARAKTYQAKLRDLETELGQTKLTIQEAGKGERDRIVKDAEETAVRMQKDATFLLEQEAKQVRLDLQREAALSALEAARELLKKRVTESDQERMAEEFLASLDQRGTLGQTGGAS
jgi:F0F1-type ATP synthase membrane subunit b/b'